MDDHWPIELGADQGFLVTSEVVAELGIASRLAQDLDRLRVTDTRKWRQYGLELAHVALQDFELRSVTLEHLRDDRAQERFGQVHVAFELEERDLGFDHPELREMASRL